MANASVEESLVRRIDDSHARSSDNELQQQLMNDCFTYFMSLGPEEHLFCERNRATIADYLLLVLASFSENEVLGELQTRSRKSLDACTNCILGCHSVRAELREKFLTVRQISYDNMEIIMDKLCSWDAKYISDRMQQSIETPTEKLSEIASNTLVECMIYPKLLRTSPDLRQYFDNSWALIDHVNASTFQPAMRFFPGMIYCLFEGNDRERNWVIENGLPYNRDEPFAPYTPRDFPACVMEEYEVHFFRIQNTEFYTDERACQFWANLCPIFRYCSQESIKKTLQFPVTSLKYKESVTFNVYPLCKVFVNHSFSYLDKPLPFLLRVLSIFLEKLGNDFFQMIKPHNYLSLCDLAFKNKSYLATLAVLPPDDGKQFPKSHSDSSLQPLFGDMFVWIRNCYKILPDTQKVQFASAIFNYMMDKVSSPNYGETFGFFALSIMGQQLKPTNKIYSTSLTTELLNNARARALVDKKCITVFDAIKTPALSTPAMELIRSCLEYDIDVMAQYSYFLQKGDATLAPPTNFQLWNLLQTKVTGTDRNIASNVLGSFRDVASVHAIDINYLKTGLKGSQQFPEEKLRELVSSCSKHNRNVNQWMLAVEKVMSRIVEYSGTTNMQDFLKDPDPAKGLWACVLSPEQSVYESGMSFLYEAFDVDGRFEAFKEAMTLDLANSSRQFTRSLRVITKLELFRPSQRVVKILMDISNCLLDPMLGLLAARTSALDIAAKDRLVYFWAAVWEFLRMIYSAIYGWAGTYEKLKASVSKDQADKITTDLLEFTRDTLDLSQSVFDGFPTVTSVIREGMDEARASEVRDSVFHPVLATLDGVIRWLRLSDTALVSRCVKLIDCILSMSIKLDVKVSDLDIATLTKLCIKAPRFNNRLTDDQSSALLLRARQINSPLVEKVLAENKPRSAIRRSVSPDVVEIEPPRLSAMEQSRQRLMKQRSKASALPAREPAPARPSGFNKRKHESDSDSDSDDDEAATLFTKEQVAAKMRRSKEALSSIQYPHRTGTSSLASQQQKKKELLRQKERQEEAMRLRLNVDMSPFYHHVLSWSYEQGRDYPVDSKIGKYQTIKDSFSSAEDYQKTFEPLLLLECWQSIQQAKQVANETPFKLTVASRSATDTYYDVYASIDKSLIVKDHVIGESDLIVLMYIDNLPEDKPSIAKRQLKNRKASCFARVRGVKISGKHADITLRVATDCPMLSFLSPSVEVVGMRIMAMTTIEREYSSLKGLQYYDLCDQITKAEPTIPESLAQNRMAHIQKVYDVNDSQAQAIAGTVHSRGFSLIQGPPGTGKTKTILGIVGYFLTSSSTLSSGQKIMVPESKSDVSSKDNRRILICAPSNAAVDELVLRLKHGIKNSKGGKFTPKIVRLGRSEVVNEHVKDVTLEEQVDAQLSSVESVDDSAIRMEHQKCVAERNQLREQLDSGKLSDAEAEAAEIKLQDVMRKRRELGRQLDEAREKRTVSFRNRDIERRNLQFKIVNGAQVVCSTLSGAAHDVLAGMSLTFDTVVIDEACQCVELSSIIPLRYGCTKCVMVGDPNQLPPTVLSQKAASYKYEQSLFVRMQNNHKNSVYLLDTQYRMHPAISRFPSAEFYDSKLRDGPNMAELNAKPWHRIDDYGPYRFFDIKGMEEKDQRTMSVFNYTEASIAVEIIEDLLSKFPQVNWSGNIGVISPYKEQVKLLKKLFEERFGNMIYKQIDFNTVDGFQGQEKDVILFSCVRAENHTGIGFLADIRRMNVALTRARTSLWVLGSERALVGNKNWKDLVKDAHARDLVTSAYRGFTKARGDSSDKIVELELGEADDDADAEVLPNMPSGPASLSAKAATTPYPSIPSKPSVKKRETKVEPRPRSSGYLAPSSSNSGYLPQRTGRLPPKRSASHLDSNTRKFNEVPEKSTMFKLSKSKLSKKRQHK